MESAVDLIVIGGGSGGIAAAAFAKKYKLASVVVLFNYVSPSTQGTKWNFGGTCLNVGCIPKKILHFFSRTLEDSDAIGLMEGIDRLTGERMWDKATAYLNRHIKMKSFKYRGGLTNSGVIVLPYKASFVDSTTVTYHDGEETRNLRAKKIIIAVGGRPEIPNSCLNGEKYGITSDDIFYRKQYPGKTLTIGSGYIATELAGILRGFGCDVTISHRSNFLAYMDQQVVGFIVKGLEKRGIKMKALLPTSIHLKGKEYEVTFADGSKDLFETVLFATGRKPSLERLGLEKTKVVVNTKNKISVNETSGETDDQSIYAIGDVASEGSDLTPVAIVMGENAVRSIYGLKGDMVDISHPPTVVFAPDEFGTVGLTEAEAVKLYGKDSIKVYLKQFESVEWEAVEKTVDDSYSKGDLDNLFHANCFVKLITHGENETIVGCHYCGTSAGEVIQVVAIAMKAGLTKAQLNQTIAVHPTCSESLVYMDTTAEDFIENDTAGTCGGGRCG